MSRIDETLILLSVKRLEKAAAARGRTAVGPIYLGFDSGLNCILIAESHQKDVVLKRFLHLSYMRGPLVRSARSYTLELKVLGDNTQRTSHTDPRIMMPILANAATTLLV